MTVSEPATTPAVTDGRTARAQRTRRAVVDALLALIEEGDLRPTGPRIAERAGVSLRSVFQHYNDLESLFGAAGERQLERIADVVEVIDASQPLLTRITNYADQRARVLELITPARRASLVQEAFSDQLRSTRDRMYGLARAEVRHVFDPELAALDLDAAADLAAAIDAASSWGAWDALRTSSGLDVAGATRVLALTLVALLAQPKISISPREEKRKEHSDV